MSIGPLGGVAGSAAGAPLAQAKGSEVERVQQDTGSQELRVNAAEKAEAASGIGEADGENHETSERDADGRRLWELNKPPGASQGHPADEPQVKDPTGQAGNLLDLSG